MRRTKEAALQTRETVLKAAAQIIVQQGMNAFTIETVAHTAGVTKGGVLHHFHSKEDLINGLIDQVTGAFRTRLEEELKAEPVGQAGRWLRAYIHTIFSVQYKDINLIPALAAAVAANHQTIERLQHSMKESQMAAVQDGLDPTLATILRLAADGVVFTTAFNLNVLDRESSQNVSKELIRLTGLSSFQNKDL